MHKILFYRKFISRLYMFRAHVFIIRKSKLYYSAYGIITPIGGRPVHSLSVLSLPAAASSVHCTISYKHSLVLLRMCEIIARNTLS